MGLGSISCATLLDAAIDRAANRTGERVGEAVGDRVGDAIVRKYSPMMAGFYTSYLFGLAFGAGGYAVGSDYQPGQWTRWNLLGDQNKGNKASTMERAYFKKTADNKQWWRVKLVDGESGDTTVMEALFSADRSQLLRLRTQMPGEEAKEVPVEDQSYYTPPRTLTTDSMQGAKVGTESITVPAGSFKCDHLRYGQTAGGTWDWWINKGVPGGMVRYSETAPSGSSSDAPEGAEGMDSDNWTLELQAHGAGAKSELGVE